MYLCRLIKLVNIYKEGAEGQKRRTRTGMIKVLGLSHKRGKKSDPRLAWFMFHKIYCMYSDIKNKEERNADMLLTIMSEHEESKKDNGAKMIIPSDLNDIQPRATHVWN